ncbi:MAG: GIY-YIG nuclease family protein [Sulfuricurvum sp.]|nr:GIY-YIG nuclease family protein [Sulfuricurvum sp.]
MNNKKTLDDIFSDDDFGLLDSKPKISNVKNEDDRLIDSFEEINSFIDKNAREPSASSMSEYNLLASLRHFKEDETSKKILKPFDRHNLLGYVEMDKPTINDIFNDDDLGLLETDSELNIFKFNHTPKPQDKAETDFVAQRKPLKEKEFEKYEKMFQTVHQEIREGKRQIQVFKDVETHLKEERFYLLDGLLLYLESVNLKREKEDLGKNTLRRKDGRTRIIFENATLSNMLYRSLGKSLYNNGKLITELNPLYTENLFVDTEFVNEEDTQTGWIYVLKSKSENPDISDIKDLYKIGFSSTSVDERIKNAKNEATYLFTDVKKVATYKVYNRNADKLESLLHRFFAKACLNVDLFDTKGQRITPREWFVVPFDVIEKVIHLILNENIVNYQYDVMDKKIKFKQ